MRSLISITILLLVGGCSVRHAPMSLHRNPGEPFSIAHPDSSSMISTPLSDERPPSFDEERMASPNGSVPSLRQSSTPETTFVQPVSFEQQADRLPILADVEVDITPTTLGEFEQLALSNSPVIARAQARVASIQGRIVQAGLPPNPVIGYSGQQLASGGQAEQRGVLLGREFVRGGKLQLDQAIAAAELVVAEREMELERQRILSDVRLAYYSVLVAQQRLNALNELVSVAQNSVTAAQVLVDAQELSRVDLLRTQTELQATELEYLNANGQLETAWAFLATTVGLSGLPSTRLDDQLIVDEHPLSRDESLTEILAESPEVSLAKAQIDVARWRHRRACVECVPNFDVEAVLQHDNGTDSANANLVITMPLPWIDRNQGQIRETQALIYEAEQRVAVVELNIEQRFENAFQRYLIAQQQVELYTRVDGILDSTRSTLDLVQVGFDAEEVGTLELTSAQRALSEANLDYIEAIGQLWQAKTEIEGLLLTGSFNP